MTNTAKPTSSRREAIEDYRRRDAEHRRLYPMPKGGYWAGMRRTSPDRLAGTSWVERSGSTTYVVFDGYNVTAVFKGDEAHRRAGEYTHEFGGTRISAARRPFTSL